MRWSVGLVGLGALGLLTAWQPIRPVHAKAADTTTPRLEPAPAAARVLSRAFASAARNVGPAVVRIEVRTASRVATASGLIIDTAGNIITSSHVVEGADSVRVILADDRQLVAKLVGRDLHTDVALVRVARPPADLHSAHFGDSDAVQIGEWVLAIGSPLGLDQSVTAGIVSGRAQAPRRLNATVSAGYSFIQTDASINRGNAGGPLVNLEGEVIGLATSSSGGSAVPINQVRRAAQMLAKDGHAQYPFIGVALLDVSELDEVERQQMGRGVPHRGALVSRIREGAPAARAGLKPGDVITSINNRDIPAAEDVASFIAMQDVGAKLVFGFVRQGREQTLAVALEDLPQD